MQLLTAFTIFYFPINLQIVVFLVHSYCILVILTVFKALLALAKIIFMQIIIFLLHCMQKNIIVFLMHLLIFQWIILLWRLVTRRLQLILNIGHRLTRLYIRTSLSRHEVTEFTCHLMRTYSKFICLSIIINIIFVFQNIIHVFTWSWPVHAFRWLSKIYYFLSGSFHFIFVVIEYAVQLVCFLFIVFIFWLIHPLNLAVDLCFLMYLCFL